MTARAAVIMAAGHGTRMKSRTPKVLHKVGGRTLLDRIIDTVQAAGCERIHVVVGLIPAVRELVERRLGPEAVVVQDPPEGTRPPVRCAKGAPSGFAGRRPIVNAHPPLPPPHPGARPGPPHPPAPQDPPLPPANTPRPPSRSPAPATAALCDPPPCPRPP